MNTTVLIVDDVEQNLKLLEVKLIQEYYEVLTATNGLQALELLETYNVDIVLLDVMMPKMDGFEVCNKIKNNPKTTHIPVIMITALSDIENRVKGIESGADDFLTKPINDTALLLRLKSLVRTKRTLDELKVRNHIIAQLAGNSVNQIKINYAHSKILIFDDDWITAKKIVNDLNRFFGEFKVINHSDQLSKLNNFYPTVIILSSRIDNIDPLRLIMQIKSNTHTKSVPLIMIIDEENLQIAKKGVELGINDYCTYPVETIELCARIKALIRKQQYQAQLSNELDKSVHLSIQDNLTKIFNRRYFEHHLKHAVEHSINNNSSICLGLIDLDFFKKTNDTYGHHAGDQILYMFAEILKSSVRITDLVARYGGEEFAVLIHNTSLSTAKEIFDKIRQKTQRALFKVKILSKEIHIKQTISIGVSKYENNENLTNFFIRTDKALYTAKSQGRNQVVTSEIKNI